MNTLILLKKTKGKKGGKKVSLIDLNDQVTLYNETIKD